MKEYAAQTGKWKVPKAGTPEYDAVKAIQARLAGDAAPAPKKVKIIKKAVPEVVPEKAKRVKKAEKVAEVKEATAAVKEEAVKAEAAKAEEEAKKPKVKREFKEAAAPVVVDVGATAAPVKRGRRGKPKAPAMSIQKAPVSLSFD